MVSLSAGEVAGHLASAYGVTAIAVAELDRDVFRIDRADGPAWVVRVFPASRPVDAVEGDAAILRSLASAGFPAERCTAPVSVLEGRALLVTEFVEGIAPRRPGWTFAYLGALLGRLNARSVDGMRPGGAWHHLASAGGPSAEIDAALTLLESVPAAGAEVGRRDELLAAVAELDDAADLPHGFVHPDFVPANAIEVADGSLVIVDWAGAGRGPRLWSLALLLWAGGIRSPKLIDVVVSRYRRHVQLTGDELDRLAGVLPARALLLDCWSVANGRRTLTEAARSLRLSRSQAVTIADRARAAFAAAP